MNTMIQPRCVPSSTPRTTPVTAHVLIVEDDRDTALGLEVQLRSHGHRVTVARDGHSAIAIAAEEGPDLVILDLGLPGVGGIDVLTYLRVLAQDSVVVVHSAWDSEVYEEKVMSAGASLYLEKPVSAERLVRAIDCLLSGS